NGIAALTEFLQQGITGCRFSFAVVSAAPREIVVSALSGIVPHEHIHGTEFDYDPSGEVHAITRVPAGYGKVAVLEELEERLGVTANRTVYVGDGSSDVHVMLHVNSRDGFTIAVSENRQLARIARSTVLSDNAFGIVVPLLEQVLAWPVSEIRALFELRGLTLEGWERARMDRVKIDEAGPPAHVTPLRSSQAVG
ncbi:MAG: haloacid dehalogenase-like hydrolase, partial [Gammaproteobacteria bacterium]